MSLKEKLGSIDFTGVQPAGGALVDKGRYPVETTRWRAYEKEDTGNVVIMINYKIIDGKFKGEELVDFQVVTGEEDNKRFLLALFSNLGIITREEISQDGLKWEFTFGDQDENGRTELTGAKVAGEKRSIIGRKAIAQVGHRTDNEGNKRNDVRRVEAYRENFKPEIDKEQASPLGGQPPNQNTAPGDGNASGQAQTPWRTTPPKDGMPY